MHLISRLLRIPISVLLVSVASTQSMERPGPCGTEIDPTTGAQLAAQQAAGAYDLPESVLIQRATRGVVSPELVFLTFHVVRNSDGTGGISTAQLQTALGHLNSAFEGVGIEYCLPAPIDYIDDSSLYSGMDTLVEIDTLRSTRIVPGTINCYFVDNVSIGTFGLCGISSFTSSPVQGIVLANACVGLNSNPSTFPHEVGHYLDLYHTHETFFGGSCVNGSNCASTGDLLCDTPADPTLSSATVDTGCNYTGVQMDGCDGSFYSPDPHNFMSYSRKECRDFFTQDQEDRALAALINLRPELIQSSCIRLTSTFCGPAVPNSTGSVTSLSARGNGNHLENDVTLVGADLPPHVFGFFMTSPELRPRLVPGGSLGGFCMGAGFGLYNRPGEILNSGSSGQVELALDLTQIPVYHAGSVTVQSGETRHFQLWHRDTQAGLPSTHFSEGYSIVFE